MDKPDVSVLMPTFNQGEFVGEALESLRKQTLSEDEFEVIVINDGSTDETAKVLRDYRGWIHLVDRENKGLVHSCNEGLELARGRYFARADSDDFVEPAWLACLVEALRSNPAACCAYPDRYEVRDEVRCYVQVQADNLYSLESCGTVFRTDLLRRVGGVPRFLLGGI